jgi:hypothetical protein
MFKPPPKQSNHCAAGRLWICQATVRLHHANPQPHEVVDFRIIGVDIGKQIRAKPLVMMAWLCLFTLPSQTTLF